MAKQKRLSTPITSEVRDAVLAKVREASEPMDVRTLVKQLEPQFHFTVKELTPVLDEFVGNGMLIRYPGKTAKGADRFWDRDLNSIGRDAALIAMRQVELPITAKDLATQLPGPFKFVEKELTPILDEAVTKGQLHRFPPATAKGKVRYWGHGPFEYGRRMALRTLQAKGPLTAAKLQAALKELDKIGFDQVFQSLRDAKAIFPHPPLKSGPELFGIHPPAPDAYLKAVQTNLTKIIKKLNEAGVSQVALRRAIVQIAEAAGVDFSATGSEAKTSEVSSVDLIGLMQRLESGAARGALVGVRDLRRAARLPKSEFDRALFQLARDGKLSLHQHDYPASLSQAERDEMLTDGEGRYFIGVAIRQAGA